MINRRALFVGAGAFAVVASAPSLPVFEPLPEFEMDPNTRELIRIVIELRERYAAEVLNALTA